MKLPKINKGPEKYSILQLKRLTEEFINTKSANQKHEWYAIEQDLYGIAVEEFIEWLEEQ